MADLRDVDGFPFPVGALFKGLERRAMADRDRDWLDEALRPLHRLANEVEAGRFAGVDVPKTLRRRIAELRYAARHTYSRDEVRRLMLLIATTNFPDQIGALWPPNYHDEAVADAILAEHDARREADKPE